MLVPKSSRLARRLMFGYAIPLFVLVVAGLLVPMYLWVTLDRYRVTYDVHLDLHNRCLSMRSALLDYRDIVYQRVQEPPNRIRRTREGARDGYRMASIGIRQWLQDNPDPSVEALFIPADQQAADFVKATYLAELGDASRQGFTKTQLALDNLVSVTGKVRDTDLVAATRADMLRNASFVAFPTIAVLLALTIGRIVAFSLVRPLIGLTKAAVNIETIGADERLLDVTLDPPDEIGDLRRAFRSMANAIIRREQELVNRNLALDAANKRVEAVLNTTEDGIAFIDSRAMFTIVNQPFLQILQIEGNQLLGKPFFATARHLFRHVRDLPTVINRLRDLVRTPHSNLLMTVYLSGERTRIIRVASVGVRAETAPGAGSEWLGRIITLRDVTRETEVDRMKTEFVSTVSHELRTPLTAIKGYLDLMLDGQAGHITATQREFLSLAGESTDRLTTLINDILDISRIEAGGTRLRRIPTDYRPVVQHVVHMLTGQAKAKGIALGMQFTKLNPWVEGDPDRISQVMFNLVSNAIKYTPPQGKITIRVTCDDDVVTTQITDSGSGISPEDLERVFERFYRADNSSTRETGGTGLGLAITKALVERMGGSVTVTSTLGLGTTFTISLRRATATPTNGIPTDEETLRLYLVVDGDPIRRQSTASALRGHRNAVSAATSTGEALRRSRGLRPDCIVLAPFSSGVDAPSLLSDLRASALTAHIPILLTGLGESALVIPEADRAAILDGLRSLGSTTGETLVILTGFEEDISRIASFIPEALIVPSGTATQIPEIPVSAYPPILVVASGHGGEQLGSDVSTLMSRLPKNTLVMLVGDVWLDTRPASDVPGVMSSLDQIATMATHLAAVTDQQPAD